MILTAVSPSLISIVGVPDGAGDGSAPIDPDDSRQIAEPSSRNPVRTTIPRGSGVWIGLAVVIWDSSPGSPAEAAETAGVFLLFPLALYWLVPVPPAAGVTPAICHSKTVRARCASRSRPRHSNSKAGTGQAGTFAMARRALERRPATNRSKLAGLCLFRCRSAWDTRLVPIVQHGDVTPGMPGPETPEPGLTNPPLIWYAGGIGR
jgi:hypothetical protein